jgi:hypothetical protein
MGSYLGDPFSQNRQVDIRSNPITITVSPRTEQEIDTYINDLNAQLLAFKPGLIHNGFPMPNPERDQVLEKLTYTCSPKIAPVLLNSMYEPGNHFWEHEALLYYVPHSVEIGQLITKTAHQCGLAPGMDFLLTQYGFTEQQIGPAIERSLAPDNRQCWQAGASASQRHPNDAFTARLIAIAMDPQSEGRTQAIYALAANRTDESVQALKLLLQNPDEQVRKETDRAIHIAYLYRGNWCGKPLRPEDFDEKFRQRDWNPAGSSTNRTWTSPSLPVRTSP